MRSRDWVPPSRRTNRERRDAELTAVRSEWDTLVVGYGLLGAVVARRLAEAGRRVTIVERGRPVTTPPGSHIRNTPDGRRNPDGHFPAVDGYSDFLDREASPAGLPAAFTTSIVGGSGILWTNNCPRAIAGVDLPEAIPEGEWQAAYAEAEVYLEVRSDEFTDSARGAAIVERLTPWLRSKGREIGPLPLSGTRRDPEQIDFMAPADILAGGPEVRVVAGQVERVLVEGGRAVGVRLDGADVRAEQVVLAAGAVDTPRLLWASGVRPPALGRHLSFHPVLIGQVVLDPPPTRAIRDPDPLPRLGVRPTPERPWFVMVLRDTCPLEPRPPDREVSANRLVEIQAFCPVDPHPDSRMSFAETGEIAFDVPLRDADAERMEAIERDVASIASRLGRFRAGCGPVWAPYGTPHLVGSVRMGSPEDDRVADTWGRVVGVDGLSLATNGLIPSRLAVNPSLTAAALAVRTADRIVGGSMGS